MEKVPGPLKAFVIGGGILLVAGTLLLAVVIVGRASGGGSAGSGDGAGVPAAALEIALPPGARVQQVVPDGRRLILLGVDAAGAQFIAVIDAQSGTRERLLRVRPERAP